MKVEILLVAQAKNLAFCRIVRWATAPQMFGAHAKEHGVNQVTLVEAWAASPPAVTVTIIGARNVQQLESSLAAADVTLAQEQRAEILRLSYTPPLAIDRCEN